MPLLKFHLRKGRPSPEIDRILDAAHGAMLRSFGVPERDRYQLVFELEAQAMRALDTGLGIPRTEAFLLLEVVSRPRPRAAKLAFYENLCAALDAECGIATTDVMITFVENGDEDWSFGRGRAQFVTGEL